RLMRGFATLLKLDRSVGTVVVGNPEVVDATVQGDKTVVLTAKKIVGTTNVLILDQQNMEFFSATITVGTQGAGRVQIHSRGRQELHSYWTYSCTPVCERVKDEIEAILRPAPQVSQTNAPAQEAAPPAE